MRLPLHSWRIGALVLATAMSAACDEVDDDDHYTPPNDVGTATDTGSAADTSRDTSAATDTGRVDTTPPPPCSDHVDCDSDEICVFTGDCERALPHSYYFVPPSVRLPTEAPWGGSWDGFGGAPDPLMTIEHNGEYWCSFVGSDTFEASWAEWCPARVLRTGDVVTLDLVDEDLTSNDHIGTCTINVNDSAMRSIRQCRLDTGTLYLRFEPE